MALGVEPKEPQLMARLPRQASLNVLTWASWVTIGYQALSIASLTLTVYLLSIHVLHHPLAQSQSVVRTFPPPQRIHQIDASLRFRPSPR